MIKRLSVITSLLLSGATVTLADRDNPHPVTPVEHNGIKYKAPTYDPNTGSTVGFVEAYDTKTNRRIWSRQIYIVKLNTEMESDTQDIYITGLSIKDNKLHISTERGFECELDISTLDVKSINGPLVITDQ